jgi:hypothetical protein
MSMSFKERKELLKKAYRKIKNTKGKKLFENKKAYYYKTFCVEKLDNVIEMFDTTTDVYRPLKNHEIKMFLDISLEDFANKLSFENTYQSFKNNRNLFHIAIHKKSEKEKLFYFKKATRRLKKLRKILDINKNVIKFVNY